MSDFKKLQALSKNYSVLYVEDNEALLLNAQKLLEKFFHIVSVAKDGEEGLQKFKKHPYPIVITDIKMPKMDGISLLKEIKKIAPKTHVLVMSAFDDKEYLLEFIEHGVFKFLKKPVNLNSLTDALYATMLKIKEEKLHKYSQEENTSQVVQEDANLENTSLIFTILKSLKDKEEEIELHNYYQGLSITNNAKIMGVRENTVQLITTSIQQKAMQQEQKTYIVSESLPFVVECSEVEHESFKTQSISLKHLKFVKTSPVTRDTIRVHPKGGYSISLFMGEFRIAGKMILEDISIRALRVSLDALPAGLKNSQDIYVEILLNKDTVELKTQLSIFSIEEIGNKFYIVFLFEKMQRAKFMKYITSRQMELIREFKGMQNG